MIELGSLLAKFKDLLLLEEFNKETVQKVLHEVAGITVDKKSIKIKDGSVYLDIKPIYRNEILLKKELIISRLQESFSKNPPSDIR